MVLRFINSRPSLAPRLMLLAAVLAVPVVLLCGLFVKQSWRDIAVVDRELQGVAYLSAIWPLYEQAAAGAPETSEARRKFAQARDRFDPSREIVGIAIDFTDRKHMMDELNHRVKNNLATVLSLALQTAKSTEDIRLFVKLFTGRIQALAKINELLARHAWADVQVGDVVTTALRPWLGAGLEVLGGSPPDLAMSARAAVSLCLVLHELGSRAERRGSLAADGGKATIAWSGAAPEHGVLTWTEERPERPETPGGDSDADIRLIERLIRGDLGGHADFDARPDGLRARISFALAGATA